MEGMATASLLTATHKSGSGRRRSLVQVAVAGEQMLASQAVGLVALRAGPLVGLREVETAAALVGLALPMRAQVEFPAGAPEAFRVEFPVGDPELSQIHT